MPTPFTHLDIAQRLLQDEGVPAGLCAELRREESAFLLGSVAADGRIDIGSERQDTHFYRYERPLTERPWRAMLRTHPQLWQPRDGAHRAFIAAYVAHLAVDECWTTRMLRPHFAEKEWRAGETRQERFRVLHYLLSWMDERDWCWLDDACAARLRAAAPNGWLPFFPDEALRNWRNRIAQQLPPYGQSETLTVFGARIGQEPTAMRAFLDDAQRMQECLWLNVPRELLAEIEAQLHDEARSQLLAYWRESADFGTGGD